jgi:hypothetical protein
MAVSFSTRRINNNDDTVRLKRMLIQIGAGFHRGDPISELILKQTELPTIGAETGRYLLAVMAK